MVSFSSDQHSYEISSSTQGNLMKLFYMTNRYEKYSITASAVESWKKIQKQLENMLLKNLSPYKIKTDVTNFYFRGDIHTQVAMLNVNMMFWGVGVVDIDVRIVAKLIFF